MDYEVVTRVLAALEREQVRYVIFGAAALNLHGLVRFTEGLDLFVKPTGENIERLQQALRSVFADPELEEISTDDLLGEYPAQYVPPEGLFHIDVLTSSTRCSGTTTCNRSAPFGDLTVSVASPATLCRMKRHTVRLKDRADADLLRRPFQTGGRGLMPVGKFRSVEQMEQTHGRQPGDQERSRTIASLWAHHALRVPAGRAPVRVHRGAR